MIQKHKLFTPASTAWRPNRTTTGGVNVETAEPVIGADEWAAQVDQRRKQHIGVGRQLFAAWAACPRAARYGLLLGLALAFPLLADSDLLLTTVGLSDNSFLLRTAVRCFTFAILALGLTVVVGYAGLLDLGYIAFMGLAGYFYAYLSSDFVQIAGIIPYGLAIPSIISLPLIVLTVAAIGYGIGAISMRLAGDYLAIVTLGFGQVFLQLALTMTRVHLPGRVQPVDFTHGPNGINQLAPLNFFGYAFATTTQYYYLFLSLLVLVYILVTHLNQSRIGRSWRAIREDELAAEVMGIPTRQLKLLAFAVGAGIAALAGAVDAAFQGSVAPTPRYSVLTLINLYAMVVLGGLGSLPGAVIGAAIFTILPELLRNLTVAGYLFYGVLLFSLPATIRPWPRFARLVGGTVLGGYLVKLVVNLLVPGVDVGYPPAGSVLNRLVQGWLVIPANSLTTGSVVTVAALRLPLAALLLRARPRWHSTLVGLSIYASAFAWETSLAANPAATRILIVGLTLVILMIVRPQGLLGKAEVKVV